MAYLMIDAENVQPSLAIMAKWPKDGTAKIMIFFGKAQTKVREKAKQQLGSTAELIQIEGQGKNALDFHIAFYIGQLAAKDAEAQFVVISKDTGFRPLVKHLAGRGIQCQQISSVAEVNLDKTPAPTDEEMKAVILNLAKRGKALPKQRAALRTATRDVLGKKVDAVIEELMKRGVVTESNGKLTYKLPSHMAPAFRTTTQAAMPANSGMSK
jgi:hypothetical protein